MESLEKAASNLKSEIISYRTNFHQQYFKKANNETFETKLNFEFLKFIGYNINKANTTSMLYFNKYIDLYTKVLRNRTKISVKLRLSLKQFQQRFHLLKIPQGVSDNDKQIFNQGLKNLNIPSDLIKAINTNATKQFKDWGNVALPTPAYNMKQEALKERVIDYTILTQLQTLTIQLEWTATYFKIQLTTFSNKKLIQ